MLTPQERQTILMLKNKGESHREISHLLKVSRNTVRTVIREGIIERKAKTRETKIQSDIVKLLPDLFKRCKGNSVRIQEVLKEEYQATIAYSTLTQWCRKYELREPKVRVGQYHRLPGEEMQHDTSPHKVMIDGKICVAQCASLVLAYSRKIFIQYYPRFRRFEAKLFLADAFEYMQGVCGRCVIDNTSVILSGGAGKNAVISPEMNILCRMYDIEFLAHEVMHADRKGRVERPFHYAENNFLAGRTFSSWEDLNQQAEQWCRNTANQKLKRELGMSADQAYLLEKPALKPLPNYRPPIFKLESRIVDTEGYVGLETNRYPVKEKFIGETVDVYCYKDHLEVNFQGNMIAKHSLVKGQKYARVPAEQYHSPFHWKRIRSEMPEAEKLLRGKIEVLDHYLDALKKQVKGRGTRVFQHLLNFQRTYPEEAFLSAITKAHHYKLYDMRRVENLILTLVSDDFFKLGEY